MNHGMYLNKALQEVGYCDEERFFFYNGDGDLCLKILQAGYACVDAPDSYIEHYPHANVGVRKTNYVRMSQDLKNYLHKWDGIFYDVRTHDIGRVIEKAFVDPYKTGELFLSLHDQIVRENPKLIKPASRFDKFKQQLRWKWSAVWRKLRCWSKFK